MNTFTTESKIISLTASVFTSVVFMAAVFAQQPKQAATTIQIGPEQTLEELAQQRYGDPSVAKEIRALNNISAGTQPKPGTTVRLPGPEREQALTALQAARQSLQKAHDNNCGQHAPDRLEKAKDKFDLAQKALSDDKYNHCRIFADETWALTRLLCKEVQEKDASTNRFSVSVDEKGTTAVEVKKGQAVKVTAGGQSINVKPGHAAIVKAGKQPEKPKKLLQAPAPILPNHGSTLVTPSVYFSWNLVPGASRYVLLISNDKNGFQPVHQHTTDKTFYLFKSSIDAGTYYWFLRSVDVNGLVGIDSPPRQFIMQKSSAGSFRVEPVNPDSKKVRK